jgi:hypothetical protein
MDRRYATALALFVLLAGCTEYYRNVRHPEYANPEFHQDLSECFQKSTYRLSTSSESPGDYSVQVDQDLVRLCMIERGWQRAKID